MASVKVKFRASTVAGKEGSLYFQIILNRKVFRIRTDYKIHASEWDERLAFRGSGSDRTCYLDALRRNLLADLVRLERHVAALERSGEDFRTNRCFGGRRLRGLKNRFSASCASRSRGSKR